jgi:RNA polymerase sigma factor (TIGR02999 family)
VGSRENITKILADLRAGDSAANEALVSLLYEDLHALAGHYMAQERAGHTLQTTALVHEAYVRLGLPKDTPWESRAHLMRAAARAMRRVLIDHVRRKRARKRDGEGHRKPLEDLALAFEEASTDILDLDIALGELAATDPRSAQVVELRFFGGLTVNETARVLGVSPRTVNEDWRFARAWLREEMDKG